MSHWANATLNLKCTLGTLVEALKKVMPEWEKHMQVDEGGGLDIYNPTESYTDTKKQKRGGYNLVIKRGAPGIIYADIGFKAGENGQWEVAIDRMGLRGGRMEGGDLEGLLKEEINTTLLTNQCRKLNIPFKVTKEQGKTVVKVMPKVEQRHMLKV